MTIQEYSQQLIDFCNGMASVWRERALHRDAYASGITYACDAMIQEIEKLEEDENAVQEMKNAENAKEILNAFGKSMNLKFEVVK